jgi:hypothetical protein
MPPKLGRYGDAPAQQYMLADGSLFTGTAMQLEDQQRARANLSYMDRMTGSTFGGIALGVSHEMGASQATQDFIYGLGSSADGLAMVYGGIRGATLPGSTGQTSMSVEANLRLRYMPGWSAEQKAAADLKVGILSFSTTTVSDVVRGGKSARSMFVRENGPINRSYDIDHLVDFQLGGARKSSNLWPLDSSVNRSLGAQIHNQMRSLPPGTKINRVTIGH